MFYVTMECECCGAKKVLCGGTYSINKVKMMARNLGWSVTKRRGEYNDHTLCNKCRRRPVRVARHKKETEELL